MQLTAENLNKLRTTVKFHFFLTEQKILWPRNTRSALATKQQYRCSLQKAWVIEPCWLTQHMAIFIRWKSVGSEKLTLFASNEGLESEALLEGCRSTKQGKRVRGESTTLCLFRHGLL